MSALAEMKSSETAVNSESYRLPDVKTLQHASKLAIVDDKPIMLDYWNDSLDKTVFSQLSTRSSTFDPNLTNFALAFSIDTFEISIPVTLFGLYFNTFSITGPTPHP